MSSSKAKLDIAQMEIERAADAIWAAQYLLVSVGPNFDDATCQPMKDESCDPDLISFPNRFFGFWGAVYNEYIDKTPHNGYTIIVQWRDSLFTANDTRKRKSKKGKGNAPVTDTKQEEERDKLLRFMVYTSHIGDSWQRAGVPQEEMMEVAGNITLWQCGMSPICTPKVFGIDKSFRFLIDPMTKEALQVKYVTSRHPPEPKTRFNNNMIDTDEEEEKFRNTDPLDQYLKDTPSRFISSGLVSNKKMQEDKVRRAEIRASHARVNTILPCMQMGAAERFPDLFRGYAVHRDDIVRPHTFDGVSRFVFPSRTIAPDRTHDHMHMSTSSNMTNSDLIDERFPELGNVNDNTIDIDKDPITTIIPCSGPIRCSHLLAHVDILDRNISGKYKMGVMFPVRPDQWRRDMEKVYRELTSCTMSTDAKVFRKRNKFIRYNISMIIVSDVDKEERRGGVVGDNKESGSVDVLMSARPYVLPPTLRDRLLTPYPTTTDNNNNNNNNNNKRVQHTSTLLSPAEEAVEELMATELDTWEQGNKGWYYFSHVHISKTIRDPSEDRLIDVINISFPSLVKEDNNNNTNNNNNKLKDTLAASATSECEVSQGTGLSSISSVRNNSEDMNNNNNKGVYIDGIPALPAKGRISIIVEAVVNPIAQYAADPDSVSPQINNNNNNNNNNINNNNNNIKSSDGGIAEHPYIYTSDICQISATFDTTTTRSDIERRQSPIKGVRASQDMDYIIRGRKGHCVHISSSLTRPNIITGISIEIPVPFNNNNNNNNNNNSVIPINHITSYRPPRRTEASLTSPRSSFIKKIGLDINNNNNNNRNKYKEEPLPTLNHIHCKYCKEIARPYILMNKLGDKLQNKKDEQFASLVMIQRARQYKQWEEAVVSHLKGDSKTSIVLLEIGADFNNNNNNNNNNNINDPAKIYIEKIYEILKRNSCTFIRMTRERIPAKKGKSNTDNNNIINIIGDPIQKLYQIDEGIKERIRKLSKKQ